MKQAYRIAAAAIGIVLGAGFLSGQELLRFFGAYGVWGYVGAVVAALFFYLTVTTVLFLARESGEITTDRIVLFFDAPLARRAIASFEFIFLFLIYVLMIAASGALLADVLALPPLVGDLLFCVLTVFCSLFGVKGLVRVFSWLVPVLVVATVAIAAGSIFYGGALVASDAEFSAGFLPAALVYVSFNVVCAIPILAPVGKDAPSRASIRAGTAIATLLLTVIAVFILQALSRGGVSDQSELPMLVLSARLGGFAWGLYAFLLFGGIFSTGLSALTAINSYFTVRWQLSHGAVAVLATGLSLLGCSVALSGFRELVGFFYPVFGYIGLIPLVLLFLHAFLRKRRARRNESDSCGQQSAKRRKGEKE